MISSEPDAHMMEQVMSKTCQSCGMPMAVKMKATVRCVTKTARSWLQTSALKRCSSSVSRRSKKKGLPKFLGWLQKRGLPEFDRWKVWLYDEPACFLG